MTYFAVYPFVSEQFVQPKILETMMRELFGGGGVLCEEAMGRA